MRISYAEAVREIVRRPPSPAEFTIALNAIPDGSLMPELDRRMARPVPLDQEERNRELGMLLAMLTGLEHQPADPELEAAIRARILTLAAVAR